MKHFKTILAVVVASTMAVANAQKVDDQGSSRGGGDVVSGGIAFTYGAFGLDSPNANFTGTGTGDALFEYGWYFRLPGAADETSFDAPTTSSYVGSTATLNWTGLGASFDADEMTVVEENAPGEGTVNTILLLTNTLATDLTVSVFHYADLDVAGSFAGDEAALITSPDHISVTEGGEIAEYRAGGNTFFEVAGFNANELGLNGDGAVTNFTNSGLPFPTGDFSGGFQWDLVIPAGGTVSFGVSLGGNAMAPVPAPLIITGAEADLSLSIGNDSIPPVMIGNSFNFSLNANNAGPGPASNTVVNATLSGNATINSTDCGATVAGNDVTWNIGALASASMATCNVNVATNGFGGINMAGTITSDATTIDPVAGNNAASNTINVAVQSVPTLSIVGIATLILTMGLVFVMYHRRRTSV